MAREHVSTADLVATAAIAYVEARAALARRRHANDLAASDHRRIVDDLDADWDRYLRLGLNDQLIRDAAALCDRHRLRAYDAVHLAAALALRHHFGADVLFACWDADLEAAAARERLRVLPRSLR